MTRALLYLLILLLLCYAPVKRLDVAKLEPVEVVQLDIRDGVTYLQTDTEAWGRGDDAAKALEDMRQRTPGVIYLDTAEFLVVTEDAAEEIANLRPWLKENVKLCCAEEIDIKTAAQFLEIHGRLPLLGSWKTGDILPRIRDGKIIE